MKSNRGVQDEINVEIKTSRKKEEERSAPETFLKDNSECCDLMDIEMSVVCL